VVYSESLSDYVFIGSGKFWYACPEIYMVAIQFPTTFRHRFAFRKSEFGGSSEI